MWTYLELNCNSVIKLVNLLGVILPNEVVKRCKCRWNKGLNGHVVLWWIVKDLEALLEDPKDPFNDIAS